MENAVKEILYCSYKNHAIQYTHTHSFTIELSDEVKEEVLRRICQENGLNFSKNTHHVQFITYVDVHTKANPT